MSMSQNEAEKIKQAVATGVATTNTITVTGLAATDQLVSVIAHDGDNGTPALSVLDKTAEHAITDDEEITYTEEAGDLSGYRLVITYIDRSAG